MSKGKLRNALGILLLFCFIGCESSQNSDRPELLPELEKGIGEEHEKQEAETLLKEKGLILKNDTVLLMESHDVHFNENDELLIETLEPVRTNFKRINSMENWTSIDRIDLWETTEGGHSNFYYSGKQLEKIVVRQFGETRQRLTEYYLQNKELSFVFDKWITYNRPLLWDSLAMKNNNDDQVFDFKKSEISEDRSYFINNELFYKIENEDCGAPFPKEYLRKEEVRIQAEFRKMLNLEK